VKIRAKSRVAVVYNRDFEGAEADPENRAREDIQQVASDVLGIVGDAGYLASGFGVGDDVHATVAALRELRPAVVFNLCESLRGDNRFEALVPMLLEHEGLVYTGSGPLTLTLALHKHKTKEVLRARGIPTPGGVLIDRPGTAKVSLRYPLIVKPSREDASVGISSESVVHDPDALEARVRHVLGHYRQPALVEEYIEGREIYASLLGRVDAPPEILPLHEIDFSEMPPDRPKIVSFEGKWVEDSAEFRGTRPVPCGALDEATRARIAEVASGAFAALEMSDYGRVDIRLSPDGVPYVIDVNPNCDLSQEGGGFARAARAAGLSYPDLVLRILELALSRRKDADTIPIASRPRGPDRARRASDREPVPARGGVVRARAPRGGAEPA
jgi:D-alanine-D-alanine ligase